MEKIKNYALIILAILAAVLGFIAFKTPKVITRVEIKEVIKYITSNTAITGATSATIGADGTTAISGSNLTITNTTTTTIKEKEIVKEKFSENAIFVGVAAVGITQDVAPFIDIKIDNYKFGYSYSVFRREHNISGGVKVISW